MNTATDSRPGPNAKRHDATADIDLRRPRAEELPKQGHHSLSMGRVAGEEALRFSLHFDKHSKLLAKQSDEKKRTITELRWSDLEIGKLLGEGNFSHVYEVRLIDREVDSDTVVTGMDTIDDVWRSNSSWKVPDGEGGDVDVWDLISVTNVIDLEETTSESDFNVSTSEGENSTLTTKPRRRDRVYALKHLHPQVTKKQKSFTASAIDLVLEAKLLSCLNHRNIIKLYAVTEGSLNRAFTDSGYFLLLDRLYETLEEKIQAWSMKEKMPANKERAGRRNRLVAITRTQDHSHITERIDVAIEIVRGMEYLHSNRIIYRDLKPSNIGFTSSKRVKIFDFGLAREIVDPYKKLTGNTGSLRYMAPEVNRKQHYGLSADVYSFGILLWELCALQKPFKGMGIEQHKEFVIEKGYRPKISDIPGHESLKRLMQSCWSSDPRSRPAFTGVRLALAHEVEVTKRREELQEIERQYHIAPQTAKLRMHMLSQQSSRRYYKGGQEGSFAMIPFSS